MSETEPSREKSLKNMLEEYLTIYNGLLSIEIITSRDYTDRFKKTYIQDFSKNILSVLPENIGALYLEDVVTVRPHIDPSEQTTLEVWDLENIFEYLSTLEENIRETYLDQYGTV